MGMCKYSRVGLCVNVCVRVCKDGYVFELLACVCEYVLMDAFVRLCVWYLDMCVCVMYVGSAGVRVGESFDKNMCGGI